MKLLIPLFLIFISWGCSSQEMDTIPPEVKELKNLTTYSANVEPATLISFKINGFYGSSEEVTIGRMGRMDVDSLGRVFVADTQKKVIYVFESSGRFITQLGREGRGPGEFGTVKGVHIHKDRLYIHDGSQNRVTVITLDSLALDHSVLLGRNRGNYQDLDRAYPEVYKIYVRNNDTYLAEFILQSPDAFPAIEWENIETIGLFYNLDNTGRIVSNKLLEVNQETRTWTGTHALLLFPLRKFFGNTSVVLSKDNSIYRAGPDHFLIKIYSPNGVYQQAFYYPVEELPITKESAVVAGVHKSDIRDMESLDLPPNWPVITDMKMDDQNRLWIARTVEDMSVFEWWVLNLEGQLITKFSWPRNEPIEVIKNGYIYTRQTEEETGLQQVVRYQYEMEKS